MRVAFTLEQSWHRVPGGTAVAALETLRALERRGNVDLVGVTARHRQDAPTAWAPQVWCPSVEIRQMALPRRALYESWHVLRRPGIERATGSVELIHATGMAMPPPSAPIVYTLHDLAFRHEQGWFTANGLRFFEQSLELALSDAAIVICPSEATRRDCIAAGFEADQIRVIPLGSDSEQVSENRVRRVLAARGLSRDYVLWAGSLEPRKNVRRLVDAFVALGRPDLDLVLVGPEGWGEDAATDLASVANQVRLLGFVPRDELHALYAGAALFCYPSLLEGFGLPVIEAMAQGTPVVTSAGTATEEVLGDAGLAVDPTDVGAISSAMAEVLEDSSMAARMGRNGRERARRYTWAETAARVERAYEDAVSR